MTVDVRFRAAAIAEIDQGADWYEAQRHGMSVRFVHAVDRAVALLASAPTRQAKVYREVRLLSVKGFPYQIYYRVVDVTHVEVLSVFHVRQNPEIWKSRS